MHTVIHCVHMGGGFHDAWGLGGGGFSNPWYKVPGGFVRSSGCIITYRLPSATRCTVTLVAALRAQ
jgi:hypothetical protein